MIDSNIKEKNIIITTHVYATGPAQDLKEYLVTNCVQKLLFIGHPLFYHPKLKGSGYELFKNGNKVQENYRKLYKTPILFSYLYHPLATIWFVIRQKEKWDLFIGSDNLNAFAGVILKKLGYVDKVVYYVIDYNPHRFSNNILNNIYHWIDQFCVRYSDETWNLSERMKDSRKKYFHFVGGNQKTVPIGIWYNRIKRLPFSKIEKNTLVYMGHVIKKQGIQHIIDAVPLIIKSIPNFNFLILGDGDYIDTLKKQSQDLGISKYITFTGYIKDHKDIENRLVKCSVAVALYEKYVDGQLSFTYFTDPGKIKSYLAAGLPIIMTDVPSNAKDIIKNECGQIVKTDKKEIAEAVIELMKNSKKLQTYRENAITYAKQFDWNTIFKSNLTRILE